MKKLIVGLIAVVGVGAASAATTNFVSAAPHARYGESHVAARKARSARDNFLLLPPAAPAGQFVEYGHIKKLAKSGSHYVLRFDPAWFTSGITASVAKKEDTGSSEVPNDNYVIEEGHRLLTYLLPTSAKITVLTNQGTKGISATPIAAAELYRIVNGGQHRKLFEPLESGIWIRVRIDTVKELDQQYRP